MTHTYAEGSNAYNFFDSPSASWLVRIVNILHLPLNESLMWIRITAFVAPFEFIDKMNECGKA